ncbi:Rieske (2Fe-2S) protein [Streptomyces phaeochromogenes]|uniref:Rieske (2Fe-2S) protein n=1 Tax=Streptomyces phaeochromogenes TaxID=1923 RepID=A0ABZ1HP61_STRPH|nr:Rieske (2Fe-2S) protein [Streptomyces phaeochromogenes]MCX5598597.1 Rieske (2Fe-2S) protein [Streptomyces phaeochromogenes]WSD19337.1 Rieske (2Fe-2S) protein [Streptomyces phaeochromogenes]WSJ03855.1 Rieske (2Fe-2S) protein [Streptomyces phaeochromogenes]WSS97785.1 Rieske (2Fe-2S) protein [Streptomyces phaeochromogenes]WSW13174.1 Rieske (2Fe-2S) protein [Streptomyces phaeochromogenes]
MSSESLKPAPALCRRTLLAALGGAGIAATLTACGGSDDSSSGSSDASASSGSGGGAALAKTTDIPEGGGKIFADQGVVVTQPTAGEFKAYSTVCPHQKQQINSVADGTITCPAHGSQFNAADGSVKKGPATSGLTAAKITVSGDSITLG